MGQNVWWIEGQDMGDKTYGVQSVAGSTCGRQYVWREVRRDRGIKYGITCGMMCLTGYITAHVPAGVNQLILIVKQAHHYHIRTESIITAEALIALNSKHKLISYTSSNSYLINDIIFHISSSQYKRCR